MLSSHTSPTGGKFPHASSKSAALLLIASAALAGQRAAETDSPALWLRCAVQARRAVVALSGLEFSFWVDRHIDQADGLLLDACEHLSIARASRVGVAS